MSETTQDKQAEKQAARLVVEYETIRRRQHDLITSLIDVLPKVNGLPEDAIAQTRDALFHADHPYLIVFVGPFSSGKSSLINALLGSADLLPVGPTPTTDRINMLRYGEVAQRVRSGEVDNVFHPSPLLRKVSFVDTPGLESIFKQHENTTRRFLHRSDTVLLVMLATQAMTQRNVDYLRTLKDYGKQVIVLLNQIDLLQPGELETVRRYVLEQGRDQVGMALDLWEVSSKLGLQARRDDGTVDPELWQASGLWQVEHYIDTQLSDLRRLKQKLQTPMQITQNVHQTALAAVRGNQGALDHYQSLAGNIEQQLAVCLREQEKNIRQTNDEIGAKFDEVAARGSRAIREAFSVGRAPGLLLRGVFELLGLARIGRGTNDAAFTQHAFDEQKVYEPLREIPSALEKLPPRLEGRDVQDIDDLVKYAKREIEALPANMRSMVIGTVQPPAAYDRSALTSVRAGLEVLEDQTRDAEPVLVEKAVRQSVALLAAYEVALVVVALLLVLVGPGEAGIVPLTLILVVILGLLGLLIMPLRGRALAHAYMQRTAKAKAQYLETLRKAADKQVDYGMRLRREAIAPLTRLIEAQTTLHDAQLTQLQTAGQELVRLEADVAALGKANVLGIRI